MESALQFEDKKQLDKQRQRFKDGHKREKREREDDHGEMSKIGSSKRDKRSDLGIQKERVEEKTQQQAGNEKKKKKKKKKNKKKKQDKTSDALNVKRDREAEDVNHHDDEVGDVGSFAFDVSDAADHCETPLEAYEDVCEFLDALGRRLGKKTRGELRIYDPYYCAGGVVARLAELGFTQVRNENRDCYADWQRGVPRADEFDVFLTNPPYSGDHVERLVRHLATLKCPYALVVPNWVHKKDYHRTLLEPLRPFYLCPTRRYIYAPPKGLREKKTSDTHKKTSPWQSMWHLYGGPHHNDALVQQLCRQSASENYVYCRSRNAVRDQRRKK